MCAVVTGGGSRGGLIAPGIYRAAAFVPGLRHSEQFVRHPKLPDDLRTKGILSVRCEQRSIGILPVTVLAKALFIQAKGQIAGITQLTLASSVSFLWLRFYNAFFCLHQVHLKGFGGDS